MATNFPVDKDEAATTGGESLPAAGTELSDTLSGHPSHAVMHENVGDAIIATQTKVGIGSSAPVANTVLTGTGSGESAWSTVSAGMIGDDQVTEAKLAAGIPGVNAAGTQDTSGNATTASKWATARTLTVNGDMTGDVSIKGDADMTLTLEADLEAADIPNLSAGKITTDTLHADRIPNLSADKITADTFHINRIPDIGASKIDAGTFGAGNYTFPSNLTVSGGLTLGGRDLGEIVPFTPSWDNVSGSWQSNTGYYAYVKDLVYISVEAELSASTSVNNTIRLHLPVTGSDTHQSANGMMQVQLFDSNENKYYQGMTVPYTTSKVEVRYNIVVGNEIFGQPANGTGPFTWADGDKILISGIYRAGT